MDSASDPYADVVATYIEVIRRDSSEAAIAIETILARFGSRTTLRATLVITLVKMEVQKNRGIEDISAHSYLVKNFPEAWPLLQQAISYCLIAWGVPGAALVDLLDATPPSADEEASASAPEPPFS